VVSVIPLIKSLNEISHFLYALAGPEKDMNLFNTVHILVDLNIYMYIYANGIHRYFKTCKGI
jgi:hypothetical protein